MREAEIYLEQLDAMNSLLENQLADVPEEKLHQRPGAHQNTVGWNYWHLLRVWDLDVNWLAKGQDPANDAWHRGGFTEKTGYNPDGKGRGGSGLGVGYTDEEVDELQMSFESLRGYHQMLLQETREYLQNASDDELRRQIPDRMNPGNTVPVAARIQHMIGHNYNHIGELRYAKGLLGMYDATYPGGSS